MIFKLWAIYFTLQAYTLLHTLKCKCDSLFNFSYLNLKAVLALPKMASSAKTYKSISFIYIYMYIPGGTIKLSAKQKSGVFWMNT